MVVCGLCGVRVARLTPDQRVACSNHVRVILLFKVSVSDLCFKNIHGIWCCLSVAKYCLRHLQKVFVLSVLFATPQIFSTRWATSWSGLFSNLINLSEADLQIHGALTSPHSWYKIAHFKDHNCEKMEKYQLCAYQRIKAGGICSFYLCCKRGGRNWPYQRSLVDVCATGVLPHCFLMSEVPCSCTMSKNRGLRAMTQSDLLTWSHIQTTRANEPPLCVHFPFFCQITSKLSISQQY